MYFLELGTKLAQPSAWAWFGGISSFGQLPEDDTDVSKEFQIHLLHFPQFLLRVFIKKGHMIVRSESKQPAKRTTLYIMCLNEIKEG